MGKIFGLQLQNPASPPTPLSTHPISTESTHCLGHCLDWFSSLLLLLWWIAPLFLRSVHLKWPIRIWMAQKNEPKWRRDGHSSQIPSIMIMIMYGFHLLSLSRVPGGLDLWFSDQERCEQQGGQWRRTPLGGVGVGVASLMKALCLGINTYSPPESSSEMNGSLAPRCQVTTMILGYFYREVQHYSQRQSSINDNYN